MSTKQKNRHGRIGIKRSTHMSASDRQRKQNRSDRKPKVIDKKEHESATKRLMQAWAGRLGARSWGRTPGPGTQRAKEREVREAARRDEMYGTAPKRVALDSADATWDDQMTVLRKSTIAQLKKICDDNGIEYKAKDTKATLLKRLGVED